MSELTQADQYLLDRVREGDSEGWSQLVDRHQGRLLAFARSRAPNLSDAEDLVQETFIAFLRGSGTFRGEASIETYLFSILRRKIATQLRNRRLNVCTIQDTVIPAGSERLGVRPAAPEQTASWYARRDEQHDLQSEALARALRELVKSYKASLDFKHLEVVELLFYSQMRNKDVARLIGLEEKQVALIKHRSLKRIQQQVAAALSTSSSPPASDAMLTEVWEELRLSCPKRSTIGGFVLGTLDSRWVEYVEFHLHKLGCRFCLANLTDLQQQSAGPQRQRVHNRIMESTVGFLHRT
jgi:RNA polymerase sigma factor (sigma-70 family)